MHLALNHSLRSLLLLSLLTSSFTIQPMNKVQKTLQIIGTAGTCILTAHTAFILYNKYLQEPLRHAQENKDHRAPEHIQNLLLTAAKAQCGKNPRKWLRFYYAQYTGYTTAYDGPPKDKPNYFIDNPTFNAFTSLKGGIFFPCNSFFENLMPSPRQRHDIHHEGGHIINGDITKIWNRYKTGNKQWFQQEHDAQKACIKSLHKDHDYQAIEESITCPTLEHIPYFCGTRSGLQELLKKSPHDKKLQDLCSQYSITNATPTSWKTNYARYLTLTQCKKTDT